MPNSLDTLYALLLMHCTQLSAYVHTHPTVTIPLMLGLTGVVIGVAKGISVVLGD